MHKKYKYVRKKKRITQEKKHLYFIYACTNKYGFMHTKNNLCVLIYVFGSIPNEVKVSDSCAQIHNILCNTIQAPLCYVNL